MYFSTKMGQKCPKYESKPPRTYFFGMADPKKTVLSGFGADKVEKWGRLAILTLKTQNPKRKIQNAKKPKMTHFCPFLEFFGCKTTRKNRKNY
jgi:hypothetical protein